MNPRITVIGLGYVGLPTAALLASRGMAVQGVDSNAAVRATLAEGRIHITEADVEALLERALRAGLFTLHAEPPPADVFIIAVPTPLGEDRAPMLGHVLDATRALAPALRPGNLVLLESTSPIGTTARIAALLAELRPDLTDLAIAYGPERVLPGRILTEMVENDRVAGGLTPEATQRAIAFYSLFVRGEVVGTDAATAEMVKLSENAFRDVNIAFANELSLIAGAHGLDVWRVIEIANRHPRVNILRPGPGVGGHCIAVDPWFLAHGAPEAARLIPAARAVDAAKRAAVLDQASALCAAGERLICLGLAFKADVDDLRESPALEIAAELARRHPGQVVLVEPHLRAAPAGVDAPLVTLEEALAGPGALLVLTDHAAFRRIPRAQRVGRRILDTRGIFRDEESPPMPDGSVTLPALTQIEAVVQTYLDGLYEGNGAKIAAAFHPVAHLYNVVDGAVVDLPRADWLTMIAGRPSPVSRGLAREDRILAMDMAGEDAACVKVNCCIPPRYFTDYLLLLKTAEGWKIVSKSFHTELRPA